MSSAIPTAHRGGGRQLRHLSQPVILEEVGPPRLVRAILTLVTVTVFAFIGWTAVTTVKETTKASGEVVPSGSVMAIQHLEGGIVSEIFVQEGDLVDKGSVLARLDPTATIAQLEELEARRIVLEIRRERLRAFAEGREPSLGAAGQRYADVIRDELATYRQQARGLDEERQVLVHQAEQRQAELDVLRRESAKLRLRVDNLAKQNAMHETLVRSGLVSRLVYLQTLEQYDSAVGDRAEVEGKIERARSAIEEARVKIARLDSTKRNEALAESGTVSGELASINETIVRARDRVTRLDVRAPVRGIVKGLTTHTIGGVVAPGGLITEIVPAEGGLVVEARISPADIGHISPGQKATVKVTTFDFARFGAVEGEVKKISATTFKDRQDEIYYKAEVKLAKGHVGDRAGQNLILPGMVTEIDVITGERTVLRYLLRPIFQSLDTAFTER